MARHVAMGKAKRCRLGSTSSSTLDRFGVIQRTSKSFAPPNPKDPESSVWPLCPPLVDELADKIEKENPGYTQHQILGQSVFGFPMEDSFP